MMMRLLQENGDITTNGRQFVEGIESVEQLIKTRLRLFLGEYFRNIKDGTPWWQQVLGKNRSRAIAEATIRDRIAQTEGVVRITEFTATYTERTILINASVMTRYGEGFIEYGEDYT